MDNLKIEYLPVEDLVPYQNNARKHTNTDVSAIAKSIEMFGFDDPIGIWKGNVIIEGHGRLMAAKQLGMETVPVIRLDHLTDEERRSYALVHNKSAELSEWDDDMLSLELKDIVDIDMSGFGFMDVNDIVFDGEIEGGEIEDKTGSKVAVKIVFESTKQWRTLEEKVRKFVDGLENVSVSVGEYNEGQQGND